MPKEFSFPIPLKYIDVVRRTNTTLDVLLESRTDDYWNVDGDRMLSEPWTCFTQFTIWSEKPPDGYTWSGGRLTKVQATSRLHFFVAKSLVKYVEWRSKKKKRHWAIQQPKPGNARKMTRNYCTDLDDMEFKDTMKNRAKLSCHSSCPVSLSSSRLAAPKIPIRAKHDTHVS